MLPEDSPVVLHTRAMAGFGGGPEKTILNSPRFLEDHGYTGICAYMHPANDPGFDRLLCRAKRAKAPVLSIPDHGPLDIAVVRRLIRICQEHRVSIWHGHDYKSNAIGLLVRRFVPMKLVTTVHGWVEHTRRTPLYYGIDRVCLRFYDQVICVSQDLVDECRKLGLSSSRLHHIRNAIDTEDFKAQMDHLSRPAGTRVVLGALGRLSEEKGFDLLVDAVDRLLAEGCDVSLRIGGTGQEHQRLARRVTELGREERIQLLGYQEDPRKFFADIDVFVLSSRREGLPNVLLEAMALEVPVIATRIAGIPNLIQHGVNGHLVAPGSADALADGLRVLVESRQLRSRLADAGRNTIESSYSFSHRMQQVVRLYDRVLGRVAPDPLPAMAGQA